MILSALRTLTQLRQCRIPRITRWIAVANILVDPRWDWFPAPEYTWSELCRMRSHPDWDLDKFDNSVMVDSDPSWLRDERLPILKRILSIIEVLPDNTRV